MRVTRQDVIVSDEKEKQIPHREIFHKILKCDPCRWEAEMLVIVHGSPI